MSARGESTTQRSDDPAGLSAGGYIIFDMPDAKKGIFHDLLKGFEDYAKLRGYEIIFSIDNSFANKIAFKFTLDSSGIVVSTKQVRQDLKEYIEKVKRGDSLDDLPVILPAEEHNLLLVAMKNRINFLQHTYTLQKNTIDFYNNLLKQLPSNRIWCCACPELFLASWRCQPSFQLSCSEFASVSARCWKSFDRKQNRPRDSHSQLVQREEGSS
jgi:hypothetical protein